MKIGVMVGREKSFPESIIERINASDSGCRAEMVVLGGVGAHEICDYSVIIDRISHDVPFYRTVMKKAVLDGTTVLVNPFWFAADDKYFGTALAERLGIAIPKTILLPQKAYQADITSGSLRNLAFPLDWDAIVEEVGLPAIMKPYDGGGWRGVNKINSIDELFHHYDESDQECMMLQEFIDWDRYLRVYCIGGDKTLVMGYDPAPMGRGRYFNADDYIDDELRERVERETMQLTQALGYEINALEWAIRDNIPYAIDFTNPVCDAERSSVGEAHHNWFVEHVADLAIGYATSPPSRPDFHWSELMKASTHNGAAAATPRQPAPAPEPEPAPAPPAVEAQPIQPAPEPEPAPPAVEAQPIQAAPEPEPEASKPSPPASESAAEVVGGSPEPSGERPVAPATPVAPTEPEAPAAVDPPVADSSSTLDESEDEELEDDL